MTQEQEKALALIAHINAEIHDIERGIWMLEDVVDYEKGRSKWIAFGKLEALRVHLDYLRDLDKKIDAAFGIGWECTETNEWDIASQIATMKATCKTMKRADGQVRYDYNIKAVL